jgi:putative oxidoreductase
LRGVIGALFVGHGTQKLFGWFGGPGLQGASGMMESLELRPPKRHAIAAGVSETAGGALVLLGALTPFATTALTATMVTAIRKVHAHKGPWVTGGGYEYNLVLIAALTALAENGPGPLSVDRDRMHGPFWALASLAAGIAGSYLATTPPVNEPSAGEPTGRFTRTEQPVQAVQ